MVFPLIFALGSLHALLLSLLMVRDRVSIYDTRVVNAVRPLIPKIPDQQVPLPPFVGGVYLDFPAAFPLAILPHTAQPVCATCKYFGVVAHVCGSEGLSYKVGDPIMELVVTRRDKAALLEVQGVEY